MVGTSLTGIELGDARAYAKHEYSEKVLDKELKLCYCKRMMLATERCDIQYAYRAVRMLKEAGIGIVAHVHNFFDLPVEMLTTDIGVPTLVQESWEQLSDCHCIKRCRSILAAAGSLGSTLFVLQLRTQLDDSSCLTEEGLYQSLEPMP